MLKPEYQSLFTEDKAHSWLEWFLSEGITNEFCEWWVGYYDRPEDYGDRWDNDDYFVYMGKAWSGWVAGRKLLANEMIVKGVPI